MAEADEPRFRMLAVDPGVRPGTPGGARAGGRDAARGMPITTWPWPRSWPRTVFGAEQRAALDALRARARQPARRHRLRHRAGRCGAGPCACWPRCWRFWQMRGYLPEARDKANRILQLRRARRRRCGCKASTRPAALPTGRATCCRRASGTRRRERWPKSSATSAAWPRRIYNESFTYSLTPGRSRHGARAGAGRARPISASWGTAAARARRCGAWSTATSSTTTSSRRARWSRSRSRSRVSWATASSWAGRSSPRA